MRTEGSQCVQGLGEQAAQGWAPAVSPGRAGGGWVAAGVGDTQLSPFDKGLAGGFQAG